MSGFLKKMSEFEKRARKIPLDLNEKIKFFF